ncbi:MAG: phosphotransferase [Eubacteriales bacterium]|nr:phosphotransferase [Eubacteriales bacterium]
MAQTIDRRILLMVLSNILAQTMTDARWRSNQLQGGTLGNVSLVQGEACTESGVWQPFQVVRKSQQRWIRPGDPDSWRREYDLAASDLHRFFLPSLRWPTIYHYEQQPDKIELWMEYVDGVSGLNLTDEMMVQAAAAMGRFQSHLTGQSEPLNQITCLSDSGTLYREYRQWSPDTIEYQYLRSDDCGIPRHLRQLLIETQAQSEAIFTRIRQLPVVFCQKDFWHENIFFTKDGICLIDWDCAGWGFPGEDIASLIADDTPTDRLPVYFEQLIPAYLRGLGSAVAVPADIAGLIWQMIVIKFGYRILQGYQFSHNEGVRQQMIQRLQMIYDLRPAAMN